MRDHSDQHIELVTSQGRVIVRKVDVLEVWPRDGLPLVKTKSGLFSLTSESYNHLKQRLLGEDEDIDPEAPNATD